MVKSLLVEVYLLLGSVGYYYSQLRLNGVKSNVYLFHHPKLACASIYKSYAFLLLQFIFVFIH